MERVFVGAGLAPPGVNTFAIFAVCAESIVRARFDVAFSTLQNLIHQLSHGAVRFQYRKSMIHRPGKVGIRKCDAAKRRTA